MGLLLGASGLAAQPSRTDADLAAARALFEANLEAIGHRDRDAYLACYLHFSPIEVLVASALGGARAMGRDADLGSVEAGKLADLLVVGSDPTADIAALRDLRFVVRGGVLRPLAELAAVAAR